MTKSMFRCCRVTAAAALLLLAFSYSEAFAQETEGKRLFDEARALMLSQKFAEACPKLAESQRVEPHVGTLLNLAACHERLGRVGTAWGEYQRAATAARVEGQTERARLAEERAHALEAHVPWLTIVVPRAASADTQIALDGADLARLAWGKEMPLDPGHHRVTATVRQHKVFEEDFELAESERKITLAAWNEEAKEEPSASPVFVNPVVTSSGSASATPAPAPGFPAAAPSAAGAHGHWMWEAGLFAAYANYGTYVEHLLLNNRNLITADGTKLADVDSLAEANTAYPGSGGVSLGVNLFGGYALGSRVHVGLRTFLSPPLSVNGLNRGFFFAGGPSILVRVGGPLRLGASLLFGDSHVQGTGVFRPPPGYVLVTNRPLGNVDIGILGEDGRYKLKAENTGWGAGASADVQLFERGRHSVSLNVSPFFFSDTAGTGTFFCIPVGLSYRFY